MCEKFPVRRAEGTHVLSPERWLGAEGVGWLAKQREQLVQGLGQIKSSRVFTRELYFQDDGVKSRPEFSAPG